MTPPDALRIAGELSHGMRCGLQATNNLGNIAGWYGKVGNSVRALAKRDLVVCHPGNLFVATPLGRAVRAAIAADPTLRWSET